MADFDCGSTVFVLADEVPQSYTTPFASDDPFHPSHTPTPTSPAISAQSNPLEILHDSTDSEEGEDQEGEAEEEEEEEAQASASSATPQGPVSSRTLGQLRTGTRRRRVSSSESSDTETVVGRDSQEVRSRDNQQGGPTTGRFSRAPRPRTSRSKRQRLMNTEMRHDTDRQTSSNGSHASSNGASLSQVQKSKLAAINSRPFSVNGRSSVHTNGDSPSSGKSKKHASYFGHDREEVSRLLIQSLHDLGYRESAERLVQESGYEFESGSVAAFRSAVLQGQWLEAESILFGPLPSDPGGGVSIMNGDSRNIDGLLLADGVDKDDIKFRIRRQKYLELLEERNLAGALLVLRQELTPLHREVGQLHILSRYVTFHRMLLRYTLYKPCGTLRN